LDGPDSAFKDFCLYDILGSSFVRLGRKALLDVSVLEELVKTRVDDGFISRALLPFARKLVYLGDTETRTDSVRMEGIFHNRFRNMPSVLPCSAPPLSIWADRGVTDVGHLYHAVSGAPLTLPQLFNRFDFDLVDQQSGVSTPFRIPDRRLSAGSRVERGHRGALHYLHHALGPAGAGMGPMLSDGVVWRQIRDRVGGDLPNGPPAFYVRLSSDQLCGGPARFDPPPREVLELVDPYVPGQEHVVLRVRRLDESLHLASDDGVTANVRVFDVVTRHRRVVVNEGRFVGYVCAGAAISHDMGVETDLSAGGRPANDPKRYTSIADLNAKQLEAVLYPRPHPAVLLKFLKEWNELAADCPGVMESAKLTGAKGALARNACSVLHLPKKKQLFHRILLRAVMVGRNVRDFAPERDRQARRAPPTRLSLSEFVSRIVCAFCVCASPPHVRECPRAGGADLLRCAGLHRVCLVYVRAYP